MNDNLSEEEKNLYRNPDLLRQREELREQINNLQPPQHTLTGGAKGGGKAGRLEQARELAEALAAGTFSIELVKRLRANTFYVPPGGLVAQAIDFLLAEWDEQKKISDRLADYNIEAAADFDRANGERLKLVAERDRQARDVARLKEDKERLGREISRLNDVINERSQELVAAIQRGDELKGRCEGLVDRISDMEKREATWDNGQGATYWRTQYEKLSQEHAAVVKNKLAIEASHEATIEKWRERVNELEERNAHLVENQERDDKGKVPRFLVARQEGGVLALLDPEYVVAATLASGYLAVKTLDAGDMVFAGEWADRVWNELVSARTYR